MPPLRACVPFLFLAVPAAAQSVTDCDPVPPVTVLVEPWEETSVVLADGAVRLALLERLDGGEGVGLVVLTLPPSPDVGAPADADRPARRCRIVGEGGIGFASVDLAGLRTEEDPLAATLTVAMPALRFIPESTELEEVTLRLTFGIRDDALRAEVETLP